MKSALPTIAIVSLLIRLSGAEFHNLEFDEANIDRLVTLQPHFSLYRAGTVSDLLPNWSISYDGVSYTGLIQFQAGLLDIPSVWFASAGSNEQGYYFGFVPSAAHDSTRVHHFLSLSQTGRVPDGAVEINTYGTGPLFMNDVALKARPLEEFSRYAWDVRQFAGQEVKLEVRNYNESGGYGIINIDFFGFVTPEPSEWTLMLLGGGLVLLSVRRRAKAGTGGM